MRRFALVSFLALTVGALVPAAAGAQQSGSPMADLLDTGRRATDPPQWAATRPTPFAMLSHASKEWIKAETRRQVETPRPTLQVAMSIDEILDRDMRRLARSLGVRKPDVSNAILLKIMIDVKDILERQQREARRIPVSTADSEALAARIARAEADRKEAMQVQTSASLEMVMM